MQCCGQCGQTLGGATANILQGLSLDINMAFHRVSAVQAGEAVVGVRPEQGAVEAATAALAARARERATRVRLVWRYAGRAVEAAGPLLGGWGCRMPLHFCPREGCWAAEVQVHAAPVTVLGYFAAAWRSQWCARGLLGGPGAGDPLQLLAKTWRQNGLHAAAILCAQLLIGSQSAAACGICAKEAVVWHRMSELQLWLGVPGFLGSASAGRISLHAIDASDLQAMSCCQEPHHSFFPLLLLHRASYWAENDRISELLLSTAGPAARHVPVQVHRGWRVGHRLCPTGRVRTPSSVLYMPGLPTALAESHAGAGQLCVV